MTIKFNTIAFGTVPTVKFCVYHVNNTYFFRKEGDVVQTNSVFPGLVVEHSADGQNSWKSGNIANPGSHVYLRTRYMSLKSIFIH